MPDDFVTPRELADALIGIERRFGRIEKILVVLAGAVIAPKLGAPDLPTAAGQLVAAVLP